MYYGVQHTSIEQSQHRMILAQRSHRSHISNLHHLVRLRQVIPLSEPEVIHIQHNLSQKPVVCSILPRVDQVRSNIRADRQRKKVTRRGINIEVSIAGCAVVICRTKTLLISVVGVEETTRAEQALQSRASDRLCRGIVDLESDRVRGRVESSHLVGTARQPLHGEEEVLCEVSLGASIRSIGKDVLPVVRVQLRVVL